MSELNNAVNIQIINRHLKIDIERTNLEDVLREVALKLTENENKLLDLKHELDLKDKSIARLAGLAQ